jgi:hypothetical protein
MEQDHLVLINREKDPGNAILYIGEGPPKGPSPISLSEAFRGAIRTGLFLYPAQSLSYPLTEGLLANPGPVPDHFQSYKTRR